MRWNEMGSACAQVFPSCKAACINILRPQLFDCYMQSGMWKFTYRTPADRNMWYLRIPASFQGWRDEARLSVHAWEGICILLSFHPSLKLTGDLCTSRWVRTYCLQLSTQRRLSMWGCVTTRRLRHRILIFQALTLVVRGWVMVTAGTPAGIQVIITLK